MSNFWDNMNIKNNNGNGFNIQNFLKFSQQMKGKDPNQMLKQMMSSGQITQDQLNNATSQANGIMQMLKSMGVIK